jgi:hypothetical protein
MREEGNEGVREKGNEGGRGNRGVRESHEIQKDVLSLNDAKMREDRISKD